MSDFDPFGGGDFSRDPGYGSDYYGKKKSTKGKGFFIFLVVVIIIYFVVKFLFLTTYTVSTEIKNTENQPLNANIIIAKDSGFSNKVANINNSESIKLKKGSYYYNILMSGYNSKKGNFTLKDDYTIEEVLEKNIKLAIKNIVFPSQVYANQEAVLEIEVENKSPTEIYNLDNLVFDGALKDWENFTPINEIGFPISKEEITFPPTKIKIIRLRFTVPSDSKPKEKLDATVKIKYKSSKKNVNFSIIEEPKINTSFVLNTTVKSGTVTSYKLTIDNSKNSISLTDLNLSLVLESKIGQEGVKNWFKLPLGEVYVESKKRYEKMIDVEVPITSLADEITGELRITSAAFKEPKTFPITLKVEEPDNFFNIKLDKTTINLDYDENLQMVTNSAIIKLTLDNLKNDVPITIERVFFMDTSPRNDCNNFIYIPTDTIPPLIYKKSNQEVLITIGAVDSSLIGDLINNTRTCTINVLYQHPFRTNDTIEDYKNIVINVE
ncbi:MAG: hypothetical protein WCY27_02570 [archaeon]|nr:hypothetical protein [archaeon]MDD4221366.1 hypothetical protein [Candidatus ainarchaeum sp.]MDD4662660.1 hypothetical protein [Candidatus ainarchaeum sp.]